MHPDCQCPRCNSKDIDIIVKDFGEQREVKPISMDELPNNYPNIMNNLVYKPINYLATCNNCGYQVRWSK